MFCPQCGQMNDNNNYMCTQCDAVLQGTTHTQFVPKEGTGSGIIPTKNPMALMAYYFGIFSVIPCAGLLLGPIAFITGIIGLKNYKAEPRIKGKAHAWTGIILGLLTSIFNILMFILPFAVAFIEG